jgi:hypothetical protein
MAALCRSHEVIRGLDRCQIYNDILEKADPTNLGQLCMMPSLEFLQGVWCKDRSCYLRCMHDFKIAQKWDAMLDRPRP